MSDLLARTPSPTGLSLPVFELGFTLIAIALALCWPQIGSGFFSDSDRGLFHPLVESLLTRDDYMLLADYQDYLECQERVSAAYSDQSAWTRMSILNCARVGRFSSDRSIREYCRDIWKVAPIAAEQTRA